MQSTPEPPPRASGPQSLVAPRRANPVGACLAGAADAAVAAAPPWSILSALLVYLSYLMNISPALTWTALALACVPYPLRFLRRKTVITRTPFDLPIALLVLGAFVGLCVSPERAMSLGAFQCLLAIVIAYYVLTSDDHPAFWMKLMVLLVLAGFVTVLILILAHNPHVYTERGSSVSKDTNHGLALQLAVAAALLFGVAAFGTRGKSRIVFTMVFLAAATAVVAITWKSLHSLITGESLSGHDGTSGRLQLWGQTLDLLSASAVTGAPFTGLGLGCWAQAFYGRMDLWNIPSFWELTHPHNAYLELFCNTGVLGALSLALTLFIGTRLSLEIITSPRHRPAYGLGIGVVLACIVTLLVGIVESAPVGAPHLAAETYYYVICPIPCALLAFLVVTHRLITREEA
jgi:hypothetical protein